MSTISATVVADSICNGHRITTMLVTFPRIILAEFNTHRMFSRNSASSRAIPFKKMVETVKNDPFIPIAWQKDHIGMQGTEYFTESELRNARMLDRYLHGKDEAIQIATELHVEGVTKQLCNRLLEPFMWHTVLVTATEWENFFHLRCPQYYFNDECPNARSRKDVVNYCREKLNYTNDTLEDLASQSDLWWLSINKGQAEIHMMALAEAMWDAKNESIPKELQPGEWHIPYKEILEFRNEDLKQKLTPVLSALLEEITGVPNLPTEVVLSTAICAQTSYTVVGGDEKISPVEALLDVHHSLLIRPHTNRKGVVFAADDPKHTSPAEHCAQSMTEDEISRYHKGELTWDDTGYPNGKETLPQNQGWCHNLRGWKSYRSMIPNENRR